MRREGTDRRQRRCSLRYYRAMNARALLGYCSVLVVMATSFSVHAKGPGKLVVREVQVTLVGRYVEGDQEILALVPKSGLDGIDRSWRVVLQQPSGRPRPWSAVADDGRSGLHFLIRRQVPPAGEVQSAILSPTSRTRLETMVHGAKFVIGDVTKAPIDPSLKSRWLRSLAWEVSKHRQGWYAFASARLRELSRAAEPAGARAHAVSGSRGRSAGGRVGVTDPGRRGRARPLSRLMDTTTGFSSIHESLQTDRQLRTQYAGEKPTVPIGQIAGPKLEKHPWVQMLAVLARPIPEEPLARAAPARFYYLRFASLAHLFRILDEADTWITPLASMSSGLSQNQSLGKRYEAQLGLQRSLASRLLGPQVVTDVALVGSDPYVREGTDLTFIFRVRSVPAFSAGLTASLAGHLYEHGKQSIQTLSHAGVTITITRSEDGRVRQHRAQLGDLVLVSNSPGAIKAVIDTVKHKAPALADEPDFRYMMARDAAVPADVLGFLSDAFVAEVTGARQKILESRRLLALSDLMTPGYAALLYGHMYGRPPRSQSELIRAGLLAKDDLQHASGGDIEFVVGIPARSRWGTLTALTPLIDLPPLRYVTETERDAYRIFAESYQRDWGQYMDPVGLRVQLDPKGARAVRADLRVLPIIDASEYREMQRTVGDARIEVPGLADGATVALGIGPQATARKLLGELVHGLPREMRSHLDWLGDLAFLGVDDRFDSEAFLGLVNREGRVRDEDWTRLFTEAPLFAGVAVRNVLTAGLALGLVRKLATEAAPGAIAWRQRGKVRGVPYVGVSAVRGGEAHRKVGNVSLYYAFCKGYLLASLNETTLKARIGDCVDGRLPKSADRGRAAGAQPPQLVFGLGMKKDGPLWQLASAGIFSELQESEEGSRLAAEAVSRGAPGLDKASLRQLAFAYLGTIPVDANGGEILGNVEVAPVERERGRRHHPALVPAPAGSTVAGLVAAFAKARSEIAFDQEVTIPGADRPAQSLHVVLSVGAGK